MSKQTPIYVGEGILAQIKDAYYYTQEDWDEARAKLLAFSIDGLMRKRST